MEAAHAVFLLGVTLTVLVIAGYLTAIVLILKHVHTRLETILGAVDAVTERSEPSGAVIDEISADLASSRQALEATVERLRERIAPAEGTEEREPVSTAADGDPEAGPRAGLGGWWKR